jgi:hypothetical protein
VTVFSGKFVFVEIGFGCIAKAGAAFFTVDLISVFEIVRDR